MLQIWTKYFIYYHAYFLNKKVYSRETKHFWTYVYVKFYHYIYTYQSFWMSPSITLNMTETSCGLIFSSLGLWQISEFKQQGNAKCYGVATKSWDILYRFLVAKATILGEINSMSWPHILILLYPSHNVIYICMLNRHMD